MVQNIGCNVEKELVIEAKDQKAFKKWTQRAGWMGKWNLFSLAGKNRIIPG